MTPDSEKNLVKPLKISFWGQPNLHYNGVSMGHAQNEKQFFLAEIEGVCCFSAIAFYRSLSLILMLDLIYQQNNNNRLYSKEHSPSSSKTFITHLAHHAPFACNRWFSKHIIRGSKKNWNKSFLWIFEFVKILLTASVSMLT